MLQFAHDEEAAVLAELGGEAALGVSGFLERFRPPRRVRLTAIICMTEQQLSQLDLIRGAPLRVRTTARQRLTDPIGEAEALLHEVAALQILPVERLNVEHTSSR